MDCDALCALRAQLRGAATQMGKFADEYGATADEDAESVMTSAHYAGMARAYRVAANTITQILEATA